MVFGLLPVWSGYFLCRIGAIECDSLISFAVSGVFLSFCSAIVATSMYSAVIKTTIAKDTFSLISFHIFLPVLLLIFIVVQCIGLLTVGDFTGVSPDKGQAIKNTQALTLALSLIYSTLTSVVVDK